VAVSNQLSNLILGGLVSHGSFNKGSSHEPEGKDKVSEHYDPVVKVENAFDLNVPESLAEQEESFQKHNANHHIERQSNSDCETPSHVKSHSSQVEPSTESRRVHKISGCEEDCIAGLTAKVYF